MDRLTKKTISCFEYDLKNHTHETGEFDTYDAFFNYHMAVKQLGEYENSGLSPEDIEKLKHQRDYKKENEVLKNILETLIVETEEGYFLFDAIEKAKESFRGLSDK